MKFKGILLIFYKYRKESFRKLRKSVHVYLEPLIDGALVAQCHRESRFGCESRDALLSDIIGESKGK